MNWKPYQAVTVKIVPGEHPAMPRGYSVAGTVVEFWPVGSRILRADVKLLDGKPEFASYSTKVARLVLICEHRGYVWIPEKLFRFVKPVKP